MAGAVWSSNCELAIPFSIQDFSVRSLLPAVMYMFRWGHRRGRGRFHAAFGGEEAGRTAVAARQANLSITDVTESLAQRADWFTGFTEPHARIILSDLLLSCCLENSRGEEGRDKQVKRVFPTHFLASWIDLPEFVSHLRMVPELLVALLARQPEGERISGGVTNGVFGVGTGIDANLLLSVLGRGTVINPALISDLAGDRYNEEQPVGLDQLLTIRVAQTCGKAPGKMRGQGENEWIPNRVPLAGRAATTLVADLEAILQWYGGSIPRQSLLPMLDVCLALGLTNIFLSSARILESWQRDGSVPPPTEQTPWPLLVDCSNGGEAVLRRAVEQSMQECLQRLERLPILFNCLNLLDYKAQNTARLRKEHLPPRQPDATSWIRFLGHLLHGRQREAGSILDDLADKAVELANQLEQKELEPNVVHLLRSGQTPQDQVWALAEGIFLLMGSVKQSKRLLDCLSCCLMKDEQGALTESRQVRRQGLSGPRNYLVRTFVLSNTALDFLVHRYLAPTTAGQPRQALSYPNFLRLLRENYGLHIDKAPPGMVVAQEHLILNRRVLEKRLRDLGVLSGVNDAESMKRLHPRFPLTEAAHAPT